MKKELLNNLKVLNNALERVSTNGRDSIVNMRDAFVMLNYIYEMVNGMPEDDIQKNKDKEESPNN